MVTFLLFSSVSILSQALVSRNIRTSNSIFSSKLYANMDRSPDNKMDQVKKILTSLSVALGGLSSGTFKSAVALTSIVIVPNKAYALPFKKYSKLAATQKLGTTPVFFLSNSGGNPYLQEDVQVSELNF